jgi:hypothetical protein
MDGLEDEGRTVVMDKYFTSIELFQKLHVRGIYATGTVQSNRIGLLEILADISTLNKFEQGSLDWRMHDFELLLVLLGGTRKRFVSFLLMQDRLLEKVRKDPPFHATMVPYKKPFLLHLCIWNTQRTCVVWM